MNKSKILQAPFLSLYSLSFYREVLGSSLRDGLFYLAFLSLIASVLAGITFNARSIPETKAFVQWLKASCQQRFKSGQDLRDLRLKSGHPLEVAILKGLGIDELVFMPES